MRVALLVELGDRNWLKNVVRNIKSELTSSSIVTSIILWLKYAGLFFTTFTATTSCVFIFWHFTT